MADMVNENEIKILHGEQTRIKSDIKKATVET